MLSIEEKVALIGRFREQMFAAADWLWRHPETGYREWESSRYLAEALTGMGYLLTSAENIPGFMCYADTGRPGPTVAVFAELDALLCPGHPDADSKTGAVHACGHHAQGAALLGLAAALRLPEVLEGLSGRIKLIAVPAEELVETAWRESLCREGRISFCSGKTEFLHRGYLADVDMAFSIHTGDRCGIALAEGWNGCIIKHAHFQGKAAHAGAAPHDGVNALNAASLGLQAIHSLRETFRDSDHVRVHGTVTSGGSSPNAVPDSVTAESYVRAATPAALADANRRVNRALAGAALAIGANVAISDRPGFAPLQQDEEMAVLLEAATADAGLPFTHEPWITACTDMGDLSQVMPLVHPYGGGATGAAHGTDFRIADPEAACTAAAKVQLALLCRLLSDAAAAANRVIAKAAPHLIPPADFLAAQRALHRDFTAIRYGETVSVDL